MNTTLGPYVAIRKEEDGEEQVATAVAVDEESNGIPPEARGLMWNDTFYDSEDGVIAVFDVDSELIKKHLRRIQWVLLAFGFVYCVLVVSFIHSVLALIPAFDIHGHLVFTFAYGLSLIAFQIRKVKIGDIHVAVTREGVRKDMNAFPIGSIFRTTTMVHCLARACFAISSLV